MDNYPKTLLIRMTEEEQEIIKARAKQHGKSLSRYVVESALSNTNPLSSEELELQQQALFHVRRIGQKLNQVVKSLRAGVTVNERHLDSVLMAQANTLRELREVLRGKSRR